jgi:hypothetical protein
VPLQASETVMAMAGAVNQSWDEWPGMQEPRFSIETGLIWAKEFDSRRTRVESEWDNESQQFSAYI